jgi:hypothetical protein
LHVRSHLLSLLLNNCLDNAIAIYLPLALAKAVSANSPDCWPTLLEDLVGAASLSSYWSWLRTLSPHYAQNAASTTLGCCT